MLALSAPVVSHPSLLSSLLSPPQTRTDQHSAASSPLPAAGRTQEEASSVVAIGTSSTGGGSTPLMFPVGAESGGSICNPRLAGGAEDNLSVNLSVPLSSIPLCLHGWSWRRNSSLSSRRRGRLQCIESGSPVINSNESSFGALELKEIRERCSKWLWKGHAINYLVLNNSGDFPNPYALLLVHGFGASIAHWRRNMRTLAQSHTVYAIDLLGFGASDKPAGFAYTMEVWAQLILDFLEEIVQKPTVLIGNSIGSLACVIAASEQNKNLIHGLVLLNCAGGMNNKAIVGDWRIRLLMPLLWLLDLILRQRAIASAIFERIKQRENLKNILLSVYGDKESVDENLVEIIKEPTDDEGALDAFVSIVTGPPGPNPLQLVGRISLPILVLWGDQDPLTPIDGPVGKYFSSLPSELPNMTLCVLEGVGHCPHDDRPYLVHEKLLPWLQHLPAPA